MQLKLFKKKLITKKFISSLINLISTFVLSCVMTINPLIINAEVDDEYLTFNDFELWQAYAYWWGYGLNSNISYDYTNTLNSISQSNASGTFEFSGNFSGTINAAISLSYIGEIGDTSLGVASIIQTGETTISGDANNIELSLTYDGYTTYGSQGSQYACQYNAQSTASNAIMTCIPQNTTTQRIYTSDQTISLDTIELYEHHSNQYLVKMLNEGTETGTLTGSLGLSGSGSGSLSFSENGTISTTSVNSNRLTWVFPIMTGNINNNYNVRKRLSVSDVNYPMCIYFLSTSTVRSQSIISDIKNINGNSVFDDIEIVPLDGSRVRGGYNIIGFEFYKKTGSSYSFIYFEYINSLTDLIPLYVGQKRFMSDDLYRYIYGSDRLIEFLTNGDTNSQNSKSGIDSQSNQFRTDSNTLMDYEDDAALDMGNSINNISMNNNIISNNGFLNAATWVRTQYENLISYNPIGNVLLFSLSLGFALLIVGKIK